MRLNVGEEQNAGCEFWWERCFHLALAQGAPEGAGGPGTEPRGTGRDRDKEAQCSGVPGLPELRWQHGSQGRSCHPELSPRGNAAERPCLSLWTSQLHRHCGCRLNPLKVRKRQKPWTNLYSVPLLSLCNKGTESLSWTRLLSKHGVLGAYRWKSQQSSPIHS